MPQYILDMIAGQNYFGSLDVLTGIVISQTTGHTSYAEPQQVSAGQPFTVYYTVSNTTGYAQNVYGQITDQSGNVITNPNTFWTAVIPNNNAVNVTINFPNGVTQTVTYTIQVGHEEYAITTNVVGNGSITVTPQTPGTSHYPGESITIQAVPLNSDWVFSGWSGGTVSGTTNPTAFQMPLNNVTITATFTYDGGGTTYAIQASAGSGGSITPSGAVLIPQGTSQTFIIEPDQHYSISDVMVDGSSVGPVSSYTFTNVQTTHTIAAAFVYTGDACSDPTGATGESRCIDGYLATCYNGEWNYASPPATCPIECTGNACIDGFINICDHGSYTPTTTPCIPTPGIPTNWLVIGAIAAVSIVSIAFIVGRK